MTETTSEPTARARERERIARRRADRVAGYRLLADLLEQQPSVPLPALDDVAIYVDSRVVLDTVTACLTEQNDVEIKSGREYGFVLTGKFGGLVVRVCGKPMIVCTPTGTKTVTTYEYNGVPVELAP